jgi:hypothetical protein
MKMFALLAGAAALGIAGPAAAQRHEHHNSHWGRHDNGHHYGQMKHHQRWNRGQRWRSNYGTYYSYGRIPYSIRRQYSLTPRYRYYYDNGYYYGVDPQTMLVQQVISALVR